MFNLSLLRPQLLKHAHLLRTIKQNNLLRSNLNSRLTYVFKIVIASQILLFAEKLIVEEFPSAKEFIKPHKGDDNIWYFDTDVYQIVGVARFYIGLVNHIKILNALNWRTS